MAAASSAVDFKNPQSSVPAGSLSYLEALTRGRHSEQHEVPPAPSSSSSHSQPSSDEQLLLIGSQDQGSRPAGGSRGRSVSFSLPSSCASASPLPPASPPRWREHASEAGSPTLEHASEA